MKAIRYPLFWLWLVVAAAASWAMWVDPGSETIPYHVAWIGLALAYDREVWPLRTTVAAVSAFTIITGGVLVTRAREGVVGWQETAEIPLMALLLLLVMLNIRRRQHALSALAEVAERDRLRAEVRERLSRLTSHEMRTPATIALGVSEILLDRETDEQIRGDLEIVRSELSRLVLASDRLVRAMQMPDQDARVGVDLAPFLTDTVDRWHAVADRDWVVDAPAIRLVCSVDRVRACLDTLIENAVRYTEAGDPVRVFAQKAKGQVLIGVADAGPGLSPSVLHTVNGAAGQADLDRAVDAKSQTGLGFTLVKEALAMRGGRLVAGRAAEGGALLVMVIPLGVPARVPRPRPPAESQQPPVDRAMSRAGA